jgi:hypothetical protein
MHCLERRCTLVRSSAHGRTLSMPLSPPPPPLTIYKMQSNISYQTLRWLNMIAISDVIVMR